MSLLLLLFIQTVSPAKTWWPEPRLATNTLALRAKKEWNEERPKLPTRAKNTKCTYKSLNMSTERSAVNTSNRPITCNRKILFTPQQAKQIRTSQIKCTVDKEFVFYLTFSCFMCLSSFSSLKDRLANSSDWKGLYSFLMATLLPDLVSTAELRIDRK